MHPWLAAVALALLLVTVAWPSFERAAFVADDFRLLLQTRQLTSGDPGAMVDALVVENRWDADWWIPDGTVVRFFRPLIIASLALDRAIWGESPLGFVIGNVLLHFVTSLLAFGSLRRLGLSVWPSLGATLLFAGLACHAEQVFFAAGRTDTIPVLALLAGLFVFLRPGAAATTRGGLGLAGIYLIALLAKESTVWLPLAFLCIDRWRAEPEARAVGALLRAKRALYIGCAAALGVYVVVRTLVLGDAGSLPAPYVFTPTQPGFLGHIGLAGLHYASSLVVGSSVHPFLQAAGDLGSSAWTWLSVGGAGVLGLLVWAWRDRLGRLCVLLFLLALLPQLALYTSGRYLYPASLPWCALLALLVERLSRRGAVWGVLVVAATVGVQTVNLRRELAQQPLYFQGVSMGEWTTQLFREAPLLLQSPRPVYVIDLPLSWLDTQFLQQTLSVNWPEGGLTVRTLCRGPASTSQALVVARRVDSHSIELARPGARLMEPRSSTEFAQRNVVVGERIRERDYEVEVLEVLGEHASKVRVRFDRELKDLQIMLCNPDRRGWKLIPLL